MSIPSVAVIVLNWNKPAETRACLASLTAVTYPNVQIIVVDNCSTDNSVAIIREEFSDLTILQTGDNLGYAGGNNQGLRYALTQGTDLMCILNNDACVESDFLEPLVAASIEGGGLRVVTPMICEMERRNIIWTLGADLDRRTGMPVRLHAGEDRAAWSSAAPFEVGYTPGSAFLVPRQAWESVGFMDESYFLYYEETDWCQSACRAGFSMYAVPASCVWHEVGASQGRRSPEITYYMTRNVLRFLRRNLSLRRSLAPQLRVLALAHIQALGDLRHGESQRATARLRGVYDYLAGRFGPMQK